MPDKKRFAQIDLVREYYAARPHQIIVHSKAKPELEAEWLKRTGKVFGDSDRSIRKLCETGFLIKISRGVYKHDPDLVINNTLYDFDEKTKRKILEKDNYKCVVCGLGTANGADLHVDHIKPKSNGGSNTIENGQTLCSAHNFLKKNFSQLEMGKKLFIRIKSELKSGKIVSNSNLESFVEEVLSLYDKYQIDSHISDKY